MKKPCGWSLRLRTAAGIFYMAYAFIDESGDLGSRKGASAWFVFAMLIVPDERALEHVVKKVRRSLGKRRGKIGELHAHKASEAVHKKMFCALADIDGLHIISVALKKQALLSSVRDDQHFLYARLARMLTIEFIARRLARSDEPLHVIMDRKYLNKRIEGMLLSHIRDPLSIAGFKDISVSLQSSDHNKSLQTADFVSWAIFRKYELGDERYRSLIKNKIISENIATMH